MLGDAKTISDEDNERESQSFDAPGQWSTPSSPAGFSPSIAPSWDTSWTADAAAPIESNGWATAERPPDSPPAAESRAFAGWGGFADSDPAPVSQDLSGWDSPSDAVLAEVADQPWGFRATDEAPLWAVERDHEALASAWAELPDPPSSSAVAWDPAPPPPESEASVAGWADDAAAWADPVAFAPPAGESPQTAEFAESNEPIFPVEAAGDLASIPTAATLEYSEPEYSEAEAVVEGLAASEVAFHAPATEVTDEDAAPLVDPTADFESATAVVPTSDDATVPAGVPTLKRRGRLAARSAARSTAPVAVELEPVGPIDATLDDVADHVATPDSAQPHSFGPESQLDDGALADDTSPSDVASAASTEPQNVDAVGADDSPTETALTPSIEPANVADAVAAAVTAAAAPSRKAGRSFFARRVPGDTTTSSGETPKALRIAAVGSLVVGLGLFGFTVITSRSSDTKKPTVVTTPPTPVPQAADSTLPTAPVAEATLAADPIFGSNETVGSPTDLAGATVATDPIFGSEQTAGSQTVTTGATVVIDPVIGSSDSASTVDPLFGSSPAVAATVGGATDSADKELAFEKPANPSR